MGVEKVPERAASRLKGSEEVEDRDALKKGGSMREKGAEVRRALLFSKLEPFRFVGDRPAGAVRGARGDDMLARAGVVRRDGGGGMDLEGDMVKVKGLKDFSEPSLLLFLLGELKLAGSTFSPSASSKMAGSKRRLVGEASEVMAGLPLGAEFFEARPTRVSMGCRWAGLLPIDMLTVLAILRASKMLQTRVVERREGHSRHWGVGSHVALVQTLLGFSRSTRPGHVGTS